MKLHIFARSDQMTNFLLKIIFQMLQEDLEQEQVRVNSLTHMVVVVDESSGEHVTAALEEQLKVRLVE